MSQLRLTNLYLNARLLSLGSMRSPGLQDINVIMFTEACKSLESHKDEINPRPQLLQLSQQRDNSPMSTVHPRVEINTVWYSFILKEIILLMVVWTRPGLFLSSAHLIIHPSCILGLRDLFDEHQQQPALICLSLSIFLVTFAILMAVINSK